MRPVAPAPINPDTARFLDRNLGEQTLFAIWDAIERVRNRQGETVAQQLARVALAVVSKDGEQSGSDVTADATGCMG